MKDGRAKLAIALLVVASPLATSAAPARAQELAPVPVLSIDQRSEELSTWLKAYRAWEKWYERWGNRLAKNAADLPTWDRKKRPEPPAWLAEVCHDAVMVATSGGKAADTVVKTSFFQRLHLTGLWVRAQYPSTPVYGVVGMQIGVFEVGRLTLPATGVMLVMLSDGSGGHDWKPATTVGLGYRLFDFVPPRQKKPFSLHVNVASTHIHGVRDEPFMSGRTNVGFVGFSVSGRRGR
jgi:hypothetical protein